MFGSAFADAGFESSGTTGKNDQGAERLALADVTEPAERVDEAESVQMPFGTFYFSGPSVPHPPPPINPRLSCCLPSPRTIGGDRCSSVGLPSCPSFVSFVIHTGERDILLFLCQLAATGLPAVLPLRQQLALRFTMDSAGRNPCLPAIRFPKFSQILAPAPKPFTCTGVTLGSGPRRARSFFRSLPLALGPWAPRHRYAYRA